MVNKPKYIIIHGTDVSSKTLYNQYNSVNNYHRSQDFPKSRSGSFVGYHRLITGGLNYKCKEDDEIGAHVNQVVDNLSMNLQSLGVSLGFDGDIEYPPQDFYGILQKQVWDWQETYKIPNERVHFHRRYNLAKTCPGGLIDGSWLEKLLEREPIVKPIDQQINQTAITEKITLLQQIIDVIRQMLALLVK